MTRSAWIRRRVAEHQVQGLVHQMAKLQQHRDELGRLVGRRARHADQEPTDGAVHVLLDVRERDWTVQDHTTDHLKAEVVRKHAQGNSHVARAEAVQGVPVEAQRSGHLAATETPHPVPADDDAAFTESGRQPVIGRAAGGVDGSQNMLGSLYVTRRCHSRPLR